VKTSTAQVTVSFFINPSITVGLTVEAPTPYLANSSTCFEFLNLSIHFS
jgi:hypothetical protein